MGATPKTIALMRLYNLPAETRLVMDALSPHVDGFVFQTMSETYPSLVQMAHEHPRMLAVHENKQPHWSNAGSLDLAMVEAVAPLEPEVVIYLDHDDLPPGPFGSILNAFRDSGRDVLTFPYIYARGDPQHVICPRPQWANLGRHSKVARWSPKLRFDRSPGCNDPNPPHTSFASAWPLLHLYVMTPEILAVRKDRIGHRSPPWAEDSLSTIPYDPNMTFRDFMIMERRLLAKEST